MNYFVADFTRSVMPPRLLHAVISTEDSIAVGRHFYTVESLLDTIETVREQV